MTIYIKIVLDQFQYQLPPKPLPNIMADGSSSLLTTKSDNPDCCWVVSSLFHLYFHLLQRSRFPVVISPTKILFVYLKQDLKNWKILYQLVQQILWLNLGSAYCEPGKFTRSSSVSPLNEIGPITVCHPLLNPGLTKLISSKLQDHFLYPTGYQWEDQSNPKLFLTPYA